MNKNTPTCTSTHTHTYIVITKYKYCIHFKVCIENVEEFKNVGTTLTNETHNEIMRSINAGGNMAIFQIFSYN
jgi:hypothetical protein